MVREAAQNTIGHIKDTPNENNEIVEGYKRKIIEDHQNMGQGKHRD